MISFQQCPLWAARLICCVGSVSVSMLVRGFAFGSVRSEVLSCCGCGLTGRQSWVPRLLAAWLLWARWLAGWAPILIRSEGKFQNGACQCWCHQDRSNSRIGCHQTFCPQQASQLPSPSLAGSQRSSSGSNPSYFQTPASLLELRACETFLGLLKVEAVS